MKLLDWTFDTPEENLACDEALLDFCEKGDSQEVLRFWEPRRYFIVLGYSCKYRSDIDLNACQNRNIPILRRASGGGTVLQGPGCFNYSLILKINHSEATYTITKANHFIMNRHKEALEKHLSLPASVQGITDLALSGLKFSGNAQRRKRHYFLFHGTFLLNFDIGLIEETLQIPEKQPDYRSNRPHHLFLTNIPVSGEKMKTILADTWKAKTSLKTVPTDEISQLVKDKYSRNDWNLKF